MCLRELGLLFAMMLFVAGCGTSEGPTGWPTGGRQFSANGERIYFTSTSASNRPIRYEGGPRGGMMMHPLSCANCHGPEGQGGRVTMMMQSFESPAITWHALTEDEHGDGDHEHPPYTEETVKQAITRGLDPAGDRLDRLMPRWNMSAGDLDDLVDYLKTLD
jgi:cytochrome c oxidase subunit II